MATFLTNAKMSPALAARIEASVRGRRPTREDSSSNRARAIIRFVVAVFIVSVGAWLFVTVRKENARVEGERNLLLDIAHGHAALLSEHDRGAFASDAALLGGLAGTYEGDLVARELTEPGAFAATLARPAVYVHGPVESFGTAAQTTDAAIESVKDSLLLCLVDPPATRGEKDVLVRVRAAYGDGGALERATSNFVRLSDGAAALTVLSPSWEAKVRAADSNALGRIHADLDRTPMETGVRALKANLLVAAMDERAPVNGPAELDGERAHQVRLVVVDLTTNAVLLRMRRAVTPADWSEKARTDFARGLDECAFAFDVRKAAGAR